MRSGKAMRLQQVACYSAGDETGDLLWRRGEDLQLGYLLLWQKWSAGWWGVSARVWGWDKAISLHGEETRRGKSTQSSREGDRVDLMQRWAWGWRIGFGGEEEEAKICS